MKCFGNNVAHKANAMHMFVRSFTQTNQPDNKDNTISESKKRTANEVKQS